MIIPMPPPTSPDRDDAWVEHLVQRTGEPTPGNYVEDAGFTERVAAALPRKRRAAFGRREAVLVASSIAAGVIGWFGLAHVELTRALVTDSPAVSLALVVVVAVGAWGAVAAASEA